MTTITAVTSSTLSPGVSGYGSALTLMKRELRALWRQPMRIAASVGTPLLIWILLINGFSGWLIESATVGESAYELFVLPGMMTLTAVFASVFSSITVIEQRNAGSLASVLVSPAPRWSIAVGAMAGGAIVGFAQAIVLLPGFWLLGGQADSIIAVLISAAALLLTALAMSAVGFIFAWRSETTAGFHAVMNLVLLPMWLLSGAFFAAENAAGWFRLLMTVNPLAWCTEAIRVPLLTGAPAWGPLAGAALFAVCALAGAVALAGRPMRC